MINASPSESMREAEKRWGFDRQQVRKVIIAILRDSDLAEDVETMVFLEFSIALMRGEEVDPVRIARRCARRVRRQKRRESARMVSMSADEADGALELSSPDSSTASSSWMDDTYQLAMQICAMETRLKAHPDRLRVFHLAMQRKTVAQIMRVTGRSRSWVFDHLAAIRKLAIEISTDPDPNPGPSGGGRGPTLRALKAAAEMLLSGALRVGGGAPSSQGTRSVVEALAELPAFHEIQGSRAGPVAGGRAIVPKATHCVAWIGEGIHEDLSSGNVRDSASSTPDESIRGTSTSGAVPGVSILRAMADLPAFRWLSLKHH